MSSVKLVAGNGLIRIVTYGKNCGNILKLIYGEVKVNIDIAGVKQLLQEHKAIRVFVQRLRSLVDAMTPESTAETVDEIIALRDIVRNISVALYHAREATLNHETKDDEVLSSFVDNDDNLERDKEHKVIKIALDNAIMQVDLANSEEWSSEELRGLLKSVKEAVQTYYDLVMTHSLKEDAVLSQVLIESKIK